MGGKKFGVRHRGRLRGINRNLELYQYDGDEWNHLETATQEEAVGAPVGSVTDRQLEEWGKNKAEWYV